MEKTLCQNSDNFGYNHIKNDIMFMYLLCIYEENHPFYTNLGGLLRGLFWGGGQFTPSRHLPCLNLVRIMLGPLNLVYKCKYISSFRKSTY